MCVCVGVFDGNGSAGYRTVTSASCWLRCLLHIADPVRAPASSASLRRQVGLARRAVCSLAAADRTADEPAVAVCRGAPREKESAVLGRHCRPFPVDDCGLDNLPVDMRLPSSTSALRPQTYTYIKISRYMTAGSLHYGTHRLRHSLPPRPACFARRQDVTLHHPMTRAML